jgi:hypothetical protein
VSQELRGQLELPQIQAQQEILVRVDYKEILEIKEILEKLDHKVTQVVQDRQECQV